jgi:hypothetical protein
VETATATGGIDAELINRWPERKADQDALTLRLAKAREAAEADRRDLIAASEYRQWRDWIDYLKRVTAEPVKFALERADAEAARQRWNNALDGYRHDRNIYALPPEERRRLLEESDEETRTIHKVELRPVELPLFGERTEQNRRLLGLLYDVGGKTWRIIEAGQLREKTLRAVEAEKVEQQRQQDALSFERQRRAHTELMSGVRRLPDGRIITHGRR